MAKNTIFISHQSEKCQFVIPETLLATDMEILRSDIHRIFNIQPTFKVTGFSLKNDLGENQMFSLKTFAKHQCHPNDEFHLLLRKVKQRTTLEENYISKNLRIQNSSPVVKEQGNFTSHDFKTPSRQDKMLDKFKAETIDSNFLESCQDSSTTERIHDGQLLIESFENLDNWSQSLGIIQQNSERLKCFFVLDDACETISNYNLQQIEAYKDHIYVFVDQNYSQENNFMLEYPLVAVYKSGKKTALILLTEDIGSTLKELFEKQDQSQ